MEKTLSPSLLARLRFLRAFAWCAACSVALVGVAVLSGWVFGIGFLKSVVPGWVTMMVNTACVLVAAGLALGAGLPTTPSQSRLLLKQLFAGFVTLVGLLTLMEYLFAVNLGIDQLLMADDSTMELAKHPGRMAPAAAVCAVASGLSLLLLGFRPRLSQASALITLLTALVALVGYVFDVGTLRTVGAYTSMAIHTVTSFMLLSLGIMAAQPLAGFIRVLVSDTAGGTVARDMLASIPIVVFSTGVLLLFGEAQGLYDNRFTLALLATLSIVGLTQVIVRISTRLHRVDLSREQAQTELQALNALLEHRVIERTQELEAVNASLVTEIAERKRAEDDIRRLSLTDELTGLHNRRSFFLLAEQGLKAARRNNLASLLFFIDLDGLKHINDSFGHEAGDLVIMAAAQVLKAGFRDTDVVARIGGDEFVVLAIGAGELPEVISSRVQALVDELNQSGRCRYPLSLSIGVASCQPRELRPLDELLATADALMYANKQRRREPTS
ncbi:GGDEF domain-containing protein [Metapseudomonas resinovorans]|uniref:GGDEF domain-containing protein n=1 Tax=Metapseudomonas resinovorans TaxID=53412 RepID=UPI0006857E85|nr:GGDEF domain-containing protein [Pseudomonas resinovorans]